MIVTVSEFRKHFDDYLELLKYEEIYLTENGETIAKVSGPKYSAVDSLTGIFKGIAPDNLDKKDIREERLKSLL